MNADIYRASICSDDSLRFKFTSEGPRGRFEMVVQFKETSLNEVYNLSFGNLEENGQIDDNSINNNKDKNKILAAVAGIINDFTKEYSERAVFCCGNTPAKTRLYRMILNINFLELSRDFLIYGIVEESNTYIRFPFEKGKEHFGFIVQKKL